MTIEPLQFVLGLGQLLLVIALVKPLTIGMFEISDGETWGLIAVVVAGLYLLAVGTLLMWGVI